jgi:pyruvate formate lyase activating enzyme
MNVYHITYSPAAGIVHLYFWGCNLSCRACIRRKEPYNYHIRDRNFNGATKSPEIPGDYLELPKIRQLLEKLDVNRVVFMGAEPTIDPQLPQLAGELHREFSSYNVLLTNGFNLIDLSHIDEVVFSLKAHTNTLHRHYTGKSNKRALENFVKLYQSGTKLRTESIFIPEYIDGTETENIARFIAGVDNSIPYRIDAYIPTGDNPWRRPDAREMQNAVNLARKYLLNVSCLTGNEGLKHEVLRIF